MILTYKIRHGRDFKKELALGMKVAVYAVNNRYELSTKHVSHLGLKSAIANQILRKYGRDKKCRMPKNVNLIVPSQGCKLEDAKILIPCLKLHLNIQYIPRFEKINQVEVGEEYAFISVSVPETKKGTPTSYIGVDRNTTGHIAVAAHPETGKVIKMGKQAQHVHKKYRAIRKNLQKAGAGKVLKRVKRRESNIIRNLNHQVSSHIIDTACRLTAGIKLERLTHIRKRVKSARSFRYFVNSWSYAQLESMIVYKAKLHGIEVVYIEPAYTSQNCSCCGHLGERNRKSFKCPHCGHVDHADANAAFNIAKRDPLQVDRDSCKGSTDTPQAALCKKLVSSITVRTQRL